MAVALEVEGQAAAHDAQPQQAQRVLLIHKLLHNGIEYPIGFKGRIDNNGLVRLFQRLELALQQLGPHEVPFAALQAGLNGGEVAAQIDEAHPPRVGA